MTATTGNKLVIVSAPSGAGKTTIVKHLLKLPLGFGFSVSATSRAPRPGETDGKDYYFLTPAQFREKIGQGAFVEWEEVYPGIFYGTLKSEIDRIFSEGRNVIFDVDVQGGLNIRRIYGKKALALFIMPPSPAVLRQRLTMRSTESPEKIEMRLAKAAEEMGFAGRFDLIIINDSLETAIRDAGIAVTDFLAGTGDSQKPGFS